MRLVTLHCKHACTAIRRGQISSSLSEASSTVKILKFWHPKICCNHLKSWTRWLFLKSNASKRCRETCLIWVCTVCPDLSVRKLRNIMAVPYIVVQTAKPLARLWGCQGSPELLPIAYVIRTIFKFSNEMAHYSPGWAGESICICFWKETMIRVSVWWTKLYYLRLKGIAVEWNLKYLSPGYILHCLK